jgi:phosphoribosylformylglycinamidine (FGAM) synthase-like amidotransferase family enzyme
MRPVTLVMPGGSSYGASMGAGDVARLQQDIFARAALAKGGAR